MQRVGLGAAFRDAFEQVGLVVIEQVGASEGAAEQLVGVFGGGEAFDGARVEALFSGDAGHGVALLDQAADQRVAFYGACRQLARVSVGVQRNGRRRWVRRCVFVRWRRLLLGGCFA